MWPPHPAGMRPRGSRRATIVRPPRIGRCGSGSDGVSGWDGRPPRLRQLKSVRNSRFSGRLPPEGHPVTHCSPADRTWEGFMNLIPEALRGYQRAWLTRDVVAGLTLSAVAIPEVMGYTSIAQTPIVTGLYTVIFPALIFALLVSSRLLVVGADSRHRRRARRRPGWSGRRRRHTRLAGLARLRRADRARLRCAAVRGASAAVGLHRELPERVGADGFLTGVGI